MSKKFNDKGICIHEEHFMVDISEKMQKILQLIEEGAYFTINRPRQYGKTTTLMNICNKLKSMDQYLCLEHIIKLLQ